MAKDYGADRTVGQNTDEWKDRRKEVGKNAGFRQLF